MGHWADLKAWRKRRRALLAEEQEGALAREARRARQAFAAAEGGGLVGVVVRWGLAEDGAGVARLLELNGMPRWVAFEERFVVAEERGRVTAAVRYQTGPDRLLLGLLVADPLRDEGALARALYSRVRDLARDAGCPTVVVRRPENPCSTRGAGFRRRGWGPRVDATAAVNAELIAGFGAPPEPPGSRWRRAFSLWGRTSIPFFGTTSDGDTGR